MQPHASPLQRLRACATAPLARPRYWSVLDQLCAEKVGSALPLQITEKDAEVLSYLQDVRAEELEGKDDDGDDLEVRRPVILHAQRLQHAYTYPGK